jgi:hypothetical protein
MVQIRIFSHISTLPAGLGRDSYIRGRVTASPVCSPSRRTKGYEIYGGVGRPGRMLRSAASTAGGGAWGEARVGRPAQTSFDDPISGLRVAEAGSLAGRQLARHQTRFCAANRRERVGGVGCGSPGRGLGVAPHRARPGDALPADSTRRTPPSPGRARGGGGRCRPSFCGAATAVRPGAGGRWEPLGRPVNGCRADGDGGSFLYCYGRDGCCAQGLTGLSCSADSGGRVQGAAARAGSCSGEPAPGCGGGSDLAGWDSGTFLGPLLGRPAGKGGFRFV